MISRRTLFTATALLPLAARNWDRAGFPDWSSDHIDKLLTDSPWARPHTLPFRFSAPPRLSQFNGASHFDQIGEPLGLPKGWPGSTVALGWHLGERSRIIAGFVDIVCAVRDRETDLISQLESRGLDREDSHP